jgi:hypothetical protein
LRRLKNLSLPLVLYVLSTVNHLVLVNLEEAAATEMSMKMKILLKAVSSMTMATRTVRHPAVAAMTPSVRNS